MHAYAIFSINMVYAENNRKPQPQMLSQYLANTEKHLDQFSCTEPNFALINTVGSYYKNSDAAKLSLHQNANVRVKG